MLRKGSLPKQKFRGVLHAQKIQLTNEEYELLESVYELSGDSLKVDYVKFNS